MSVPDHTPTCIVLEATAPRPERTVCTWTTTAIAVRGNCRGLRYGIRSIAQLLWWTASFSSPPPIGVPCLERNAGREQTVIAVVRGILCERYYRVQYNAWQMTAAICRSCRRRLYVSRY